MPTTLVTFLGRVPKSESGYRTTRYQFDDGSESEAVAFFGWPLAQRVRPDRLVILGTAGSMWDHLFERDIELGAEAEEARLALVEAVDQSAVTREMLNPLGPLLARQLSAEVRLQLIPYCREPEEQMELLRILASQVVEGDQLHLDITHAFRHLPIIALMGVLYLRKAKGIAIDHIWYGAYDSDSGKAPVHDLAGLLKIADWVGALSSYDKDGDYGVFQDLLPGALGDLLAEASFLESVNRIGQARGKARKVLDRMQATELPDPAAALFQRELMGRLTWVRQDQFYLRQRAVALQFLERNRFIEAVLHGYEAFVTRLTQQQGLQPDKTEDREQARDHFDEVEKRNKPRSGRYQAWDSLRRLRNALAHGAQPSGQEVQRALANRGEMTKLLNELFAALLPDHS